ncbi:MAG: C1 family peptidase [Clostridiales bacterium]|nr:C1 family peptidase [Clostridiales bacterium]
MFTDNKEMGISTKNFNLRKDKEDLRDYSFKTIIQDFVTTKDFRASLPNIIDHSPEMSPVKDQERLGSCVGFATTALKEWQEQKEHKEEVEAGKKNHRDEKYYDLSEAWVYWNCKKIDAWPNDEGTDIRSSMKVLHKIGVPTEKAWPYDDVVYGEPKNWASMVARWSLIRSYYRVGNLEELKGALVQAPVVIGIGCYEEILQVGSNGIIPYPANPRICYGGHAVCAVGYNDRRGFIKFKNSWSSDWGENGYGYLPYSYIRDFMWDAWAAKDLRVTKEMLKGASQILELKNS